MARRPADDCEDGSAQGVAGQVVGALEQTRLCELWQDGTPEWQAAHPWSEVRARWLDWIDGLGSLAGPGSDPYSGAITAEVVSTSPETFTAGSNGEVLPVRLVAHYYLRGRKIAEVELVHFGGPDPKGQVPNWRFTRFGIS